VNLISQSFLTKCETSQSLYMYSLLAQDSYATLISPVCAPCHEPSRRQVACCYTRQVSFCLKCAQISGVNLVHPAACHSVILVSSIRRAASVIHGWCDDDLCFFSPSRTKRVQKNPYQSSGYGNVARRDNPSQEISAASIFARSLTASSDKLEGLFCKRGIG
jgi:hypothetical protein